MSLGKTTDTPANFVGPKYLGDAVDPLSVSAQEQRFGLVIEVERVDTFKGLVGDNVLGDPVFQENVLGFAVPYGLALQSLDVTPIRIVRFQVLL